MNKKLLFTLLFIIAFNIFAFQTQYGLGAALFLSLASSLIFYSFSSNRQQFKLKTSLWITTLVCAWAPAISANDFRYLDLYREHSFAD